MTAALTTWFPRVVKPVRVGVYEVAPMYRETSPLYQHWNGEFWGGWANTVDTAEANGSFESINRCPEWRGLAAADSRP